MQHAGESIKKFYSDVVEDILPPILDPVNPEIQKATLETKSELDSYIKSVIGGINEDPEDNIIERLSTVDPIADSSADDYAFSDVCLQQNSSSDNVLLEGKPERVPRGLKCTLVGENSNASFLENAINYHLGHQPITSVSERLPEELDNILMDGKFDHGVQENIIANHLEHQLITSTSLNSPEGVDNIRVKEESDGGLQENGVTELVKHQCIRSTSGNPAKEVNSILLNASTKKTSSEEKLFASEFPELQHPAEKDLVVLSHSNYINANHMDKPEDSGKVSLPSSIDGFESLPSPTIVLNQDVFTNDAECVSGVLCQLTYSQMAPLVISGRQNTKEGDSIWASCYSMNNSFTAKDPLDDCSLTSEEVDTLGDVYESASDSLVAVSSSISHMELSYENELRETANDYFINDLYLESSGEYHLFILSKMSFLYVFCFLDLTF